ncbi:hypothetical protein MRX96_015081 [Rhipicephalus microplus]
MVTFRRVEEYDSKEPCPPYTERLDALFNAKGIEDDEKKKKCIFLSTVGTKHPALNGNITLRADAGILNESKDGPLHYQKGGEEEMMLKQSQTKSKKRAEKKKNGPRFKKGEKVAVRNFGRGPKWWLAKVEERKGSSMVTVSTPQEKVRCQNDQVKMHLDTPAPSPADTAPTEASCVASASGNVEAATVPSAKCSTRTVRKSL